MEIGFVSLDQSGCVLAPPVFNSDSQQNGNGLISIIIMYININYIIGSSEEEKEEDKKDKKGAAFYIGVVFGVLGGLVLVVLIALKFKENPKGNLDIDCILWFFLLTICSLL